jgi:hypothetical protein
MKIKLKDIKVNPKNPRLVKDEKFKKLCNSIKEFPKMMELRPIVIDEDSTILGGNMRYKALKELGFTEVPKEWIKKASELTEDEKKRFIISDNVPFGEWSWDLLESDFDLQDLEDWGVDIEVDSKIESLQDGETIEFEQSVQLLPPKEYIMILAEPNSEDWEDVKESLKLKMVRRGGYKRGSPLESVSIERVLNWSDFKKRYVNSSTEQKQSRKNDNK